MHRFGKGLRWATLAGTFTWLSVTASLAAAAPLSLASSPLFVSQSVPPLALLVLGRDHKLYYEAYNDASDLNGDGQIDIGYKPTEIDYYGYFDSFKCYSYDATNGRFTPVSATGTNKTCTGSNDGWSGDYLNYLTTARIDALRKVLYGGKRIVDTTTLTVLERSHIPQDAHSWGKEYTSRTVDGFAIEDYSPLSQPSAGTHHLFANTTLNSYNDPPLLRVLNDTHYRVWEWLSIERPVAGSECNDGSGRKSCATIGGAGYWIAPPAFFDSLTRSFYALNGGAPNNASEFQTLVDNLGSPLETEAVSNIDGNETPSGRPDNFVTVFKGKFTLDGIQTLNFGIDGDDAVELLVDGNVVVGWYGAHSAAGNGKDHTGSIAVTKGTHDIEFRHVESGGGESYRLYLQSSLPASDITDYSVRIEVCVDGMLEPDCASYSGGADTVYKPTGLLHRYGADDRMLFGLLTGSYVNNTSGGVLRKNTSSFTNELDSATGIFTDFSTLDGIVETIDTLRTIGFNYANHQYGCGWITTRPINEGECAMWGNPIAEMIYEGVRYFAGKASATGAFAVNTPDLGLPTPNWQDPYDSASDASSAGAAYCSKPFQLVISDINPSYDSDQLPGSYFDGITSDLSGLNVQAEADTITANEPGFPGTYYIGQSGTNYTGTPTPKTVNDLGEIRGLAPEEPTKLGSYYSASAAYYAHREDIHASAQDDQHMDTFSVALASPLPRIELEVNGNTVSLIPFAKSVGGSSISAAEGNFQPTNQIVDFYVDTIVNAPGFPNDTSINGGRPYYKFRINFEDVEQGADHDMDAIAIYTVKETTDGKVEVTLDSTYAAGGIIQHMGYVISGVENAGTYLEVRDEDTGSSADVDYFLDTPPGELPGNVNWNDGSPLPLTTTRTFTPSGAAGAKLLKNPLWYAAKWGGFQDKDSDDLPDDIEWDENGDGNPDNYFLVTNAGQLGEQLEAAFREILARVSSATSVAIETGSIASASQVYLARFNSGDWTGSLVAYALNSSGDIGTANWDAASVLTERTAPRQIVTYDPATGQGVPFNWSSLDSSQQAALASVGLDQDRVAYLRGDRSQEQSNGGSFRNRNGLLGDVVDATPVYVGPPDRFYPDGLATTKYSDFKSAHSSRAGVVYVGANDGMLHAFAADDGEELFAYVPSAVYDHLSDLTDPGYAHRFYVDGTPTEGDAFFDSAWHTILVGGLRAGGQGIYALDITSVPTASTSEATIASKVLWEFSDADADPNDGVTTGDADLGYTYSQPQIVRLHNGHWAAVFGNGYNNTESDGNASTTGNAVLFIRDLEDGTVIKLDTGEGMDNDPTGNSRPNGLATVTPADIDGDSIVDYVYGGDLFGNLWKFDVTGTNASQWGIAHSAPLFTAVRSGVQQPITTRPSIRRHPTGDGLLLMFGTGKYLEPSDANASTDVQSVYGIWDRDDGTAFTRDHLLEQTIEDEITQNGSEWRVLSNNTMQWHSESGLPAPDPTKDSTSDTDTVPDNDDYYLGWYLDLKVQNEAAAGEMQVTNTLVRGNRLIFTTLIPNNDPCSEGGDSWLMVLDFRSGGRFTFSPFDVDNNGVFNLDDLVAIDVDGDGVKELVSLNGQKSNGGILQTPALGSLDKADRAYLGGSDGGGTDCKGEDCVDLNRDPALINRQSWRQLR